MAATMPSVTPDVSHDRRRACSQARWSISAEWRAEYGVPGLPSCATVEADPGDARLYSVAYCLVCCVGGQIARGRRHDVADAKQQTLFWLASVNCPGQVGPAQERESSKP